MNEPKRKETFEEKVVRWMDTSVPEQTEEPETFEERVVRWTEKAEQPERNAFGNVIGTTPDEVWDEVSKPDQLIENAREDITARFSRWLAEMEDE